MATCAPRVPYLAIGRNLEGIAGGLKPATAASRNAWEGEGRSMSRGVSCLGTKRMGKGKGSLCSKPVHQSSGTPKPCFVLGWSKRVLYASANDQRSIRPAGLWVQGQLQPPDPRNIKVRCTNYFGPPRRASGDEVLYRAHGTKLQHDCRSWRS